MASNRGCSSCDRQRSLRRVELFVYATGGGVQCISVHLCGPCSAALIDSVTLYAVRLEFEALSLFWPALPPDR